MFAKDIMTKEVLTVKPDMSIRDLADFLVKNKISGVPVVDDGNKVIGIVTENDLIRQNVPLHIPTVITILDSFFYLGSPKNFEEELNRMVAATVSDLCTKKVISVEENTPVKKIANIMESGKAGHLIPVVENGKIVGIIGKADIVRAIAKGDID